MTIYLATDHAGFALKEAIKKYLLEQGHEVEDCGAHSLNKDDDYPDFIAKAAEAVSKDPASRGIIFGGSGQGEAMVANRFKGVRAAVFYAPEVHLADKEGEHIDPFEVVKIAREHNDANVLSVAARFIHDEQVALTAVKLFLETPFSNSERHVRRISKF
ncbi:MAG: ribose-5-phosphate isomerase [Candidatus Harrisonbacteria bacterium CG10_big_fil_rev_8_21_14_0_10_49_15]|uniref:Ribose-5-phosphate isomerase n=1 Tax=Candidatus Harrisonbacteria bacterium CG10_big_fil_rev_8_21_14_0_10_49_15 TaxID=1974587 RepID=A0A2H0ULQ4_9BACT|nr:MAG: ribose-5-phosphate isomerase [Candidatus Harrisonbacteria bacterium CG10_big_fil_rev_8_21_14_0_10_49_15]